MTQLSHLYMTTRKTISLTIWTFVGKIISLLSNMLSKFVIDFLQRSKGFLILWLQSLSAVILEPKKIKSVTVSTFSLSICHEVMGLDAMVLVFECWVLSQFFHSPLSPSPRGSLVPLHFLPLEWYHLHIWGYWYFSWQSWFHLTIPPAWHFAQCILHIRWQYTALSYSFPNFESVSCSMSGSNYYFLTCLQVSQEAGKVVWYSHLFKNFPICWNSHSQKL